MKSFLYCRRTFIAVVAIGCLTGLGIYKSYDVSMALASVAIGIAVSNAGENAAKARPTFRKEDAING